MFVSNLAQTVTEDAIRDLFGSIGIIKVSKLFVIFGLSFVFCTFSVMEVNFKC